MPPLIHTTDYLRLRRVVARGSTAGKEVVRWFNHDLGSLTSPRIIRDLAAVIYANAYIYGGPLPIVGEWTEDDVNDESRDKHYSPPASLAAREGAWQLTSRDGEWCRLSKPGSPPIRVPIAVIAADSLDTYSVPVPTYSEHRLPGWATLAHGTGAASVAVTRFYLNSARASAPQVAERIALALADAGISSFLIKWLLLRQHDARADSMVLYVNQGTTAAVAALLKGIRPLPVVDDRVPMFTTRLGRGLAQAKDPGGQESYGQVVSRRVARILIRELRMQTRRRVSRLAARNTPGPVVPACTPAPATVRDPRQATAHLVSFADQLAKDAIWAGDKAGWLTRDLADGAIRAAGPDVYRGSAGPILALAFATRETGSSEITNLTRAAARQALSRVEELGHGFHSGAAGTAAILAEAAHVSADPVLLDFAGEALGIATMAARLPTREWDVISGLAGTALGITATASLLGIRPPDELAGVLDSLVLAERGGRGWTTPVGRHRRRLDGLAHGSWGAILAVHAGSLALDTDSSEQALRTALGRTLLRSERSGWRSVDRRYDGYMEATSWCHGSAGAIVAARALRNRDNACDTVLDHGIEQSLAPLRATGRIQGGLCHGALGMLLCADAALSASNHGVRDLGLELIRHETHQPDTVPDLSLMTGASGIAVGWYRVALDLGPPLALALLA